ncbi:MAG: creatininase family protein [Gaiellaceae bacterium MAG52_C11]|nr:creatininase family protein [Candidatus Gaiellasilicea maunaloa]
MPELAHLTWLEAQEALADARLALVPIGSCEQHGPHLTLDTDTAIAHGFSRRLADDLGDRAVLCPPLGYGLSEHHLGFPGTITLRPSTLLGFLSDLVESLAHWGLRRLLVVNGHGGNIDGIRLAARAARRDHGALLAGLMWAQLAADAIAERVTSERYGHACEIETSVAMVLAPASLHAERISAPRSKPSSSPLTDPPGARVDRATWFEEWTEDGALGDPRLASHELGEAVVEVAYTRALRFAEDFAEEPPPEKGARGWKLPNR